VARQEDVADATPAGSAEVFTDFRGAFAQFVVLSDHGYVSNVKFGDDEDSQRLVQETRRLNRHWKLGQIAKVPPPAGAQQLEVVPASPRPREHAPRPRRTRTTPRASRDGPHDPEPAHGRPLTELQQAQWFSAVAYEIARNAGGRVLDTFLEIEAIKVASETARRWWEPAA
jgi:hypothetical protein